MSTDMFQQIADTYKRMNRDLNFHPAIEGDLGSGHIDPATLNQRAEINSYIESWVPEETEMRFWTGCPDFNDRPALIFIIEAARQVNGMDPRMAVKLLREAIRDLEARGPSAFEIRNDATKSKEGRP